MKLDSESVGALSKSVQSKARDIDVDPDMVIAFGWSKKSKRRLILASPNKFILVDDEVRELASLSIVQDSS